MDGIKHHVDRWDLMIAHPPCTYLSNVASRAYSLRCTAAEDVVARLREQEKAIVFFLLLMFAPIEKIAVENPVGIMNSIYRKPDQIIHPYYFSNGETDKENWQTKRTCFWLKNLEPLKYEKPTDKPKPKYYLSTNGKAIYDVEAKHGSKERSKTFPAVAKAIAEQWT